MRRRLYASSSIIVALLLLGLSCAPRPGSPLNTLPSGVIAGRSLGPAGEAGLPPQSVRQPLEVIHRSPLKSAKEASAIVVTFNQPMVALGASEERRLHTGACPLRVEPAVKAQCRWVAGDTLKLALDQPLKNAHRYRVTIPMSLAALSGAKLPRAETWTFDTPRPELLRVGLYPLKTMRADRMRRDDSLLLTFNVEVDPARLAKHAELRTGDKRVILRASPYVDAKTKRTDSKRVILTPVQLLPRGAKVTLSLPKGFLSMAGPLTSTRVGKAAFTTASKLALQIYCDGKVLPAGGSCWPMNNRYHHGLELRFSEPVTEKELKRALRITPPLKKMLAPQNWSLCGKTPCARHWELKERLRPRRRYRLRVAGGIKDIFAQRLQKALRTHFRSEGLPPGLFVAVDSEGFREAWHPYYVKTVNLKTFDLERTAPKGGALVRLLECMEKKGSRWPAGCSAEGEKTSRTLQAASGPDLVRKIDLKLPRGLSHIVLSSPQLMRPAKKKGERPERVRVQRLVARTDLGLHGRLTPFGVTIWVTTLRQGSAVAGAEVALYDDKGALLWRDKTDGAGVAQASRQQLGRLLRKKRPPKLYLLASHAGDAAYLTPSNRSWRTNRMWTRPGTGEDVEKPEVQLEPAHLSDAGPWRGDRPLLVGYISTERGIYRPGHVVHIHGAVRRFRSWRAEPAAGLGVEIELLGENGELLGRKKIQLSALGVFKLRLPLPEGGRLGYHSIRLRQKERVIARRTLRVAEYRPPRFALHLQAKKHEIVGSGAIELQLAARYMFGGVLDGAPYRLNVRDGATRAELPKTSRHYIGASTWAVGTKRRTWLRREGLLDSQGRLRERIVFPALGARPFLRWQRIRIDVSSPARRSVAAWHYATQYPGERMVAIKPMPSSVDANHVHLLVVDPAGKAHGGQRVGARLHPWKYSRKGNGVEVGWGRVLWRASRVVGKKGRTLRVPWPKGYSGQYALLSLRVKDRAGREAWSAQRISKPSERAERWDRVEALRRERDEQLQLSTDKKYYLPGETAQVTVQRRGGKDAPAGQAMLFVERERIFARHALSFDAQGRARVRVIVKEAYAKKVMLRVVAPRVGKALRHRLGPLVTARRALHVSSKPYQLEVGLKSERKAYRPGETVRLKIDVRDGLKRPHRAQVVLMAVDEAVLQLTGFRLPDPFHQLLHTPAIDVRADDLRRHLLSLKIPVVHRAWGRESIGLGVLGTIGHGGGSGSGYGRGSGRLGGRGKKRSRFATTAWHATLVTNDKGRARASFVLPDDLTRYRIMAFAVDGARAAGTGRTSVRVALPLSTLPALPRLLRVGDETSAGVMIQNQSMPAGDVTVVAAARGKALALSGPTRKTVRLVTGRSTTVRFMLEGRAAGQGELKFTITGGRGVSDVLVHRLPVQAALLHEAASVSGQTQAAVAQALAPLRALHPSYGGLELSLSSTALTGVEDGIEQLIAYPYGCLEQLSSRLLAMISAVALGQRFNIPLPKEPRKLIEVGLNGVLAMQRSDGGFSYWPSGSKSSPFATAYALIVLHRVRLAAAQTKVTLPGDATGRALRYLRRQLAPEKGEKQRLVGQLGYAQKAMAAYALALHGESAGPLLRRLTAKRHRSPLFVRAMLLAALAAQTKGAKGKNEGTRAALTTELTDSLKEEGTWAHAEENLHDGYQVLMHSSDRSTAMVLLALLAARPEHAMVPRLLRWFLLGRKQARFRNTQEAAWALMAFWDYARVKEKQAPDFDAGVWLGKKKIFGARFAGREAKSRQKKISMGALMAQAGKAARQLVIAKRGKGTLYYVARLRYARKKLAQRAKDHGLRVKKTVRVLDKAGRPLATQRPPRLGDMLLVTLKVESNEARRYVVVDDPLPAGLEAVDTMLATSGGVRAGFYPFKNDSWYDHRELRDDRVLFFRDLKQPGVLTYSYLARVTSPGDFSAPAAKAEEMYTPEVYGHTASGRVNYAAP